VCPGNATAFQKLLKMARPHSDSGGSIVRIRNRVDLNIFGATAGFGS
jgi:hypothetical protein